MRHVVLIAISYLALAGGRAAFAQHQAAARPVAWNLDRLDVIGGHKPEVLGQPMLIDSPQGKALRFNGSGDALFIDVNPLAGLAQFTAEVVFQPAADGP